MARQYFPHDPWRIIESTPDFPGNGFKQSIFSQGNGYMGLRGQFEEGLSGATDGFPGTYIYGVYEDEPVTNYWPRVGLVGTSALFARAPGWVEADVLVDGERLDIGTGSVRDYERVMDMRTGLLGRRYVWTSPGGVEIAVEWERFVSIRRDHVAAVSLSLRPLNRAAKVGFTTGIDATVRNRGGVNSNWVELRNESPAPGRGLLEVRTTTTDIRVATAFALADGISGERLGAVAANRPGSRVNTAAVVRDVPAGGRFVIRKLVSVATSRDVNGGGEPAGVRCLAELDAAEAAGYDALRREHADEWTAYWDGRSLRIDGDPASQQGANYNFFTLRQLYSGRDPTLNFVSKAYGEAYGGHYFWDAEITVLPCYVAFDPATARALLMFRYNTLEAAREKARALGMPGALFPWYTIDGREDSRIWEIHLLEVHMNSAVAWAINRYFEFTGDVEFMAAEGMEMLVDIARYWAARVTPSGNGGYFINGVVGPDEYHMVVNNNCYTNMMAAFSLEKAAWAVEMSGKRDAARFGEIAGRLKLSATEPARWKEIASGMYIPYDGKLGIHKQDDAFLSLEPARRDKVPESQIPLQKHWPWDRVLRTQLIKQPDVVLLMNFLGDRFDSGQKRRNYEYYEPLCMHDSSMSPAEHCILAAELGLKEDAFRYYLNIARLDLDNYNFNTNEGLHSTSMCGTFRVVVEGFAGVRARDGILSFAPWCPDAWSGYSFRLRFRGRTIEVAVDKTGTRLGLLDGAPIEVTLNGERTMLEKK